MEKPRLNNFYNPSLDDEFIGDSRRECPAVRDYFFVQDINDLMRWRALWYPSCRVCPFQSFCYPSHQIQHCHPQELI